VLPVNEYTHPVGTVEPRLRVPLPLTVISWPELEERVEPVREPSLNVNERSLSNWATSVGLACRSTSVITKLSALVVNVTSSDTGPLVVAPVGVTKLTMSARAKMGVNPIRKIAKHNLRICLHTPKI
jgi:hypothetical protein